MTDELMLLDTQTREYAAMRTCDHSSWGEVRQQSCVRWSDGQMVAPPVTPMVPEIGAAEGAHPKDLLGRQVRRELLRIREVVAPGGLVESRRRHGANRLGDLPSRRG